MFPSNLSHKFTIKFSSGGIVSVTHNLISTFKTISMLKTKTVSLTWCFWINMYFNALKNKFDIILGDFCIKQVLIWNNTTPCTASCCCWWWCCWFLLSALCQILINNNSVVIGPIHSCWIENEIEFFLTHRSVFIEWSTEWETHKKYEFYCFLYANEYSLVDIRLYRCTHTHLARQNYEYSRTSCVISVKDEHEQLLDYGLFILLQNVLNSTSYHITTQHNTVLYVCVWMCVCIGVFIHWQEIG